MLPLGMELVHSISAALQNYIGVLPCPKFLGAFPRTPWTRILQSFRMVQTCGRDFILSLKQYLKWDEEKCFTLCICCNGVAVSCSSEQNFLSFLVKQKSTYKELLLRKEKLRQSWLLHMLKCILVQVNEYFHRWWIEPLFSREFSLFFIMCFGFRNL